MLKKLGEALENAARTRYAVDSSMFDDPVADRTEWYPLSGASTRYRTHRLVVRPPARWEFRPTVLAWLAVAAWCFIGLSVLGLVVWVGVIGRNSDEDFGGLLAMGGLGACVLAIGVSKAFAARRALVFDRGRNAYWNGPRRLHGTPSAPTVMDDTLLNAIHAVQVLEWVHDTGEPPRYDVYELNLVLRDGNRVYVVAYDDGDDLRADAAEIARMLGVPLWDPKAAAAS